MLIETMWLLPVGRFTCLLLPTAQPAIWGKTRVAEFTADRRRYCHYRTAVVFTAAATRLRLSTLGFFQYIGRR